MANAQWIQEQDGVSVVTLGDLIARVWYVDGQGWYGSYGTSDEVISDSEKVGQEDMPHVRPPSWSGFPEARRQGAKEGGVDLLGGVDFCKGRRGNHLIKSDR